MADRSEASVQADREMKLFSGARVLFVTACGVVVVAGLKAAAGMLIPFAVGLFLAVLTLPVTLWLHQRRLPMPLAVAAGVLANVGLFGLIVVLAIQSSGEFQAESPRYVSRLYALWFRAIEGLEQRGLPVGDLVTLNFFDPERLFGLVGSTLSGVASVVSSVFLVVLILLFILAEATVFPRKIRAIMGPGQGTGPRLTKTVREVQEYLGIKTLVSLATGIMLGLWAWFLGLDFPVLLGVIAFVLNYVPTIGSVLASGPAVLLALLQFSVGHAMLAGAGYAVVNLVFGNLIEPNLLGRRLGLSTLVVILSLVFWGWVWGPVGMLLAVPLTMVVKIWLENTDDLRWVALLLDKGPPDPMTARKVRQQARVAQERPQESDAVLARENDRMDDPLTVQGSDAA